MMSKPFAIGAFALGLLAILWTAGIFLGSSSLALIITLLIGAVYLLGFYEIRQFRQATHSLSSALERLQSPQDSIDTWLQSLHPSLRNSVRQRIEGERVALPGPVLAPYLVGLLVMLGLLGTFIGMVNTLQGSVLTLQQADDIKAMQQGLAAPIAGLSLAFGTSVAGVAASAMLGLVLTISRRERIGHIQGLDRHIGSTLREFSLQQQGLHSLQSIQAQTESLPNLVSAIDGLSKELVQSAAAMGQHLSEQQSHFQQQLEERFQALAARIETSLQEATENSGERTAQLVAPIMQNAADTISGHLTASTEHMQQHLLSAQQQQSEQLNSHFGEQLQSWQQQLASTDAERLRVLSSELTAANRQSEQQLLQASSAFEQQLQEIGSQQQAQSTEMLKQLNQLLSHTDQLIEARQATDSDWLAQQRSAMTTLNESLNNSLSALREEEQQRGAAAIQRLSDLEASVGQHLAKLGKELEAPMQSLIATASEAPQAAAEVITQLRSELSNSLARDNQLLAERETLMQQLNTLAEGLEKSSGSYNDILAQLVDRSTETLKDVATSFNQQVADETNKLADLTALFAASSTEMASLGDSFAAAVEGYHASNERMTSSLVQIEQALEQSSLRSDEQLGYYLAQAREIIDHSILSQKQMLEELRQLGHQEQLFSEASA